MPGVMDIFFFFMDDSYHCLYIFIYLVANDDYKYLTALFILNS